jgi:putative addiction module component (TIGR02574 family)
MGAQEILKMAMALKANERIALVDKLLETLDRPDPAMEAIWAEEAEYRLAAYDEGKLASVPASEVLDRFE